jgi:activating signal cointegrator 1
MKAISLWQPWASAMARGDKKNETRHWPTGYRGDLVICSAKRMPSLVECGDRETFSFSRTLPYGFALCVVELYDMVKSEEFSDGRRTLEPKEAELGNYSAGRWIWMTRNLRLLDGPVPVVGRQQLFELPDDMINPRIVTPA